MDDLNAQLKAVLAAKDDLEKAVAKISTDFERVAQSRANILKEKRELEGRTDGKKVAAISQKDVTLTREESQNAALYQRAKELAAKHGLQVQILQGEHEPADERPILDRYETPDTVYLSQAMIRREGHGRYRAERARAERDHKRLVVADQSQFPDEAFVEND